LGAEVGARQGRARSSHPESIHAKSAPAKRAFDFVASTLLLLVLLPILAAVALLVRLDSPGPAFFRCERVGYRGRPLRMLKFRKMVLGARGAPLTLARDERFTRVGTFLTKYKLDELPQLWHVFRGEMSLVGPRPEDPRFVRRHEADYYGEILTVRPGVVGLAQLAFAEENRIIDPANPVADYVERILPQKIRLERMYVANCGFWFDMRVLWWAVATVLFRRPVAVNRMSGAMGPRRR
jgi:lipopolysaccharide/colanic/teichoic acid biosynthesis glycosyltransferase